MRESIVLCGGGNDADAAAAWAEERAHDARLSARAAKMYGERVKHAYKEACNALICVASERPIMKISVSQEALTPRFDFVDQASPTIRKTPRAVLALRAREILRERAKRGAGETVKA